MVEPEELAEFESPQLTSISQTDVKSVHAESVQMQQADAEFIRAETVEMQYSAAGNVKATDLSTRTSALGLVNSAEVHAESSIVGIVQAEHASASGYTGIVTAGSADIHKSTIGYLAAQEVDAQEVRTVVLLARNVRGNVTTTLDTRGAVIAGLIGGLFGGLMLLLGRSLTRRN